MKQDLTPKITIPISNEIQEKIARIQKKLQSEEAQKARKLLSLAMTNFEAMKYVRNDLEKKELNGSYANGFRLFKD